MYDEQNILGLLKSCNFFNHILFFFNQNILDSYIEYKRRFAKKITD